MRATQVEATESEEFALNSEESAGCHLGHPHSRVMTTSVSEYEQPIVQVVPPDIGLLDEIDLPFAFPFLQAA